MADVATGRPELSGSRRQATRAESQIRHAVADFAPPPSTRATVADSPSGTGCGPVAGASGHGVREALADDARNHGNQGGRPPVAAAYGHVPRQPGGQVPATPGQVPSLAGEAGETGPAAVALAAIEALDGNHRRQLLDRLAATDPDVVMAGVRWLQEWQSGAAERRRIRHNRDSKTRRDQRRATAADSGG